MNNLHRIAMIGTKGKARKYVSGTPDNIELMKFTTRTEAPHWNKATAKILTAHFNAEYERLGLTERFQIEKAH